MCPTNKRKERPLFRKGMPQIIARIRLPSGANREQWRAAIDRELIKVWIKMSRVKPAQARALYRVITGKARKTVLLPSRREMLILDKIIMAQAVTLGWRIMASQLVLFRCSRWSDELFVPENFERFGKMLAKSVRILSGHERPPIDDPGIRDYKRRAVAELRILLREMRSSFLDHSPGPTTKKLAHWFVKKLAEDGRFSRLRVNPFHWIMFLAQKENSDILKLQMTGRLAPAALFDSWLAYYKRHDPEYLRKRLTRLRPSSSL
jgi:hypothetical protein